MQLIGMLDSPFVRRVAISLLALEVPFTHRSVSVFRGFDAFRAINPVVKAPTAILEDGTVLLDSTLILEYAEAKAGTRTLMPSRLPELALALRVIGLALAACEKTAQIVYERGLRPAEKVHQPWIDRVSGQLLAAYSDLERELRDHPADTRSCAALGQSGITAAVAWHFTQHMLPGAVLPADHPCLVRLSAAAEQLKEFSAAPYGEDIVRSGAS
jgi:glutathione S-transferase